MPSLWNRSGTVERYASDLKAMGALAYFYNGGTTTPLTVYQDAAQTSAHPNPVVADANGRWPDVFVPFMPSYDVQVKTSDGFQLTYTQRIPNVNPTDISSPSTSTEPVTTGMIHAEMINGTKTNYVRLNGKTIGASSSSATERANDDTLALYTYLYTNLPDSIAPVSGGRTGNISNDFSISLKTIGLPNWQGAMPAGLDDMGNTAGGFYTGLTFLVGGATTPGSSLGVNSLALTLAQMPVHSHSGTTNVESPTHTHTVAATSVESVPHTHSGTTAAESPAHSHTYSGTTSIESAQHTHGFTAVLSTTSQFAAGGANIGAAFPSSGSTGADSVDHTHTYSGTTATSAHTHGFTTGTASASHTHSFTTTDGAHSHAFTTNSQGSGSPFNNMPRSFLVTWFIRL